MGGGGGRKRFIPFRFVDVEVFPLDVSCELLYRVMKEEEIPIDFQSLKKELTVIVAIMSIRNFKVTVMQIAFN